MPSILFAILIAPLTGIWIARFGGRTVTIASRIVTIGGWLCAMAWHSSVTSIAVGMCVIAAGGVILYASGPAILIGAVPAERTSEATGMMIVLRRMAMRAVTLASLAATLTAMALRRSPPGPAVVTT